MIDSAGPFEIFVQEGISPGWGSKFFYKIFKPNCKIKDFLTGRILVIAAEDFKVLPVDIPVETMVLLILNQYRRQDFIKFSQGHSCIGLFKLAEVKKAMDFLRKRFSTTIDWQSYDKWSEINLFATKVSKMSSLSDLLFELKKEFKKIKKVNPPIMGIYKNETQVDIFSFQGDKINVTYARMKLDSEGDRSCLATALGRPVAKVLAMPIKGLYPVTFFIEHDLTSGELEYLKRFVSRRLQIIETILDILLVERKLKEASHLWEKTFEGIADPVAIVDKNFNLLRGNTNFKKNLNEEKCFQVFAKTESACENCPIVKRSLTQNQKGEVVVDGRVYEVHSSPIFLYNQENIAGYANHYVDQTETLGLKTKIIQSEKMAAIGHLAGNIAHELNNPLTGIRSTAQILISESEDEEVRSDLIEVEKASARCQSIINNLLEYTRGQQGDLKKVSLQSVVRKTIPLLKTALRGINLNIEFHKEDIFINAHEQLLQQVVFNIVLNSTQAMSGEGRIDIFVDKINENGFIRIQDSGPGIAVELLPKVFDPFFTTKEVGVGTGLGLSMVKKIVESYGGEVTLHSQVGRGTVVSICFSICES